MNTHVDRPAEKNKQLPVSSSLAVQGEGGAFQFEDNRAETIVQRKLQQAIMESPRVKQLQAFQAMANNSTGRMSTSGKAPVQRMVNVTATQYQTIMGGALTWAQFQQYMAFFLNSDMTLAFEYASKVTPAGAPAGTPAGGEAGAIKAYIAVIKVPPAAGAGPTAAHIQAADDLAALINTILPNATLAVDNHDTVVKKWPEDGRNAAPRAKGVTAVVAAPHSRTAYSEKPALDYKHSNVRPSWFATYNATAGTPAVKKAAADAASPDIAWPATEADSQTVFANTVGPTLLAAATPATASRITTPEGEAARPQIKQLTWDQAKEFLPKPLLNLLFDVKQQLRGGRLVDERTPFEQGTKKTTPNAPGTLRSWHEDSKGLLPSNGLSGAAAGAGAAVPAGATALHNHYNATSESGAGSAAGAATAPVGFAEYTGAGTGNIHNTKVVLDYITSRVYLTLSHYQYWALVPDAGGQYDFIPGDSQSRADAIKKIDEHAKVIAAKAAGRNYTLMNPWIEILVP